MAWKVVYKVTWPNGKVYIGSDLTDSMSYIGSPNANALLADFPDRASRRNIMLRKEILWESEHATRTEVLAKEAELIRLYRSNDPNIGYNLRLPARS